MQEYTIHHVITVAPKSPVEYYFFCFSSVLIFSECLDMCRELKTCSFFFMFLYCYIKDNFFSSPYFVFSVYLTSEGVPLQFKNGFKK